MYIKLTIFITVAFGTTVVPKSACAGLFHHEPTYLAAVPRDMRGEPIINSVTMRTSLSSPVSTSVRSIDPLESFNRKVWNVNQFVDRYTLKPAAQAFHAVAPGFVQRGFGNAVSNSEEPWSFINNVLQGSGQRSSNSFARFAINTTLGIGGLFDIASKWGIESSHKDFGQTLAVWGVPAGPYLMLPFFGPSSFRDAAGIAANFFADPTKLSISRNLGRTVGYGYTGARIFDRRLSVLGPAEKIIEESTDSYVTVRSAYIQRRAWQISNGNTPLPGTSDDLFETEKDDTKP